MEHVDRKNPWNSLEIAKLAVQALTALSVAFVGLLIQRSIADQNRVDRQSERLIEMRLAKYDSTSDKLNRIFCFIEEVGTWKEENPLTIISYKRDLDREIFAKSAIWSPETIRAYHGYMDATFDMNRVSGKDALIRTSDTQKWIGVPNWTPQWSEQLTRERDSNHKEKYFRLQSRFARDLQLQAGVE